MMTVTVHDTWDWENRVLDCLLKKGEQDICRRRIGL